MSDVFGGNFTRKSMQMFDYKCSSQTGKANQTEQTNRTKTKHKPSVPEVSDELWILKLL